jgi:hypothetical protein
MKKLFALSLVALAAVAIYAATATGGAQAPPSRGEFNTLKKQVAKVRSDLNTVADVLGGCVMGTAAPITRYSGYVAADQNGNSIFTTALDLTEQGDTPNGYALLVNPDSACVNLVNSTSFKRFSAAHGLHFAIAKQPAFRASTHHHH